MTCGSAARATSHPLHPPPAVDVAVRPQDEAEVVGHKTTAQHLYSQPGRCRADHPGERLKSPLPAEDLSASVAVAQRVVASPAGARFVRGILNSLTGRAHRSREKRGCFFLLSFFLRGVHPGDHQRRVRPGRPLVSAESAPAGCGCVRGGSLGSDNHWNRESS
jgi:hypothetical protein